MRPIDVKPRMMVMVKEAPAQPVVNAYGDVVGEAMEPTWLGLPLRVLAVDHPFCVVELLQPDDTARFCVGRASEPREAKRHILDLRRYTLTRVKPSYARAVLGRRNPELKRDPPRASRRPEVDRDRFFRD